MSDGSKVARIAHYPSLIAAIPRFGSWVAKAAAAALAGCALLAPSPPIPPAPAFELIGRVAVNHDGRAFTSGVRWQHAAERDELWLLTPTGQALAHIVGDAGGATFTGSDGSQHKAADIGSLTHRALGWEMPVTRLAWWVQSEAAPGGVVQALERDPQGRLAALEQDGWRIAYVYDTEGAREGRLRRLEVSGESQLLRLVIDGWQRSGEPR